MAPKRTFMLNGKPVKGESVQFESISEPWARFTLSDGTEVKAKLVMLDAFKLDAKAPNGDNVFQFQFQHIVGVTQPEKPSADAPTEGKIQ